MKVTIELTSKENKGMQYRELTHGRIVRTADETVVVLHYHHDEAAKICECIYDDAWDARKFVEEEEKDQPGV